MRSNLVQLRQQSNLTQYDISQKLKISLRQYQRIESGESEGKLQIWKELSSIFNTTINFIIG